MIVVDVLQSHTLVWESNAHALMLHTYIVTNVMKNMTSYIIMMTYNYVRIVWLIGLRSVVCKIGENGMIKKWFQMKKKEFEFKAMFYTAGIKFFNEKADVMKTIQNLYESCKDVPVTELRDKFIEELATLAHAQAVKERELENANNENESNDEEATVRVVK